MRISTKETGLLIEAHSLFLGEVKNLHRGTQGYGYKYAKFDLFLDTIRPLLAKYKLGFNQMGLECAADQVKVLTRLSHISGQWIQGIMTMPVEHKKGNSIAQDIGTTFSYLCRYSGMAIMGVTQTEDDVDGTIKGGVEEPFPPAPTREIVYVLSDLIEKAKVNNTEILEWCEKGNVASPWDLKDVTINYLIDMLRKRISGEQ